MPWAAGSYSKGNNGTGGWVGDASLGIGIEAGRHDTQDNDFATGINQCLNKDGSNAATGNLNLGGFKYTNAAAATFRTDLPQVAQVQDGDFIWLGTTGGTATAQTANASPAITAYKAGQKFRAKIGVSLNSTGTTVTAHTINVNSVGTKNIVNQDGTNPTAGTWVAGAIIELVYDGTNFVIINDPGGWQSYTPSLTPNGGSISSLSIVRAVYRKHFKTMHVSIRLSFNTTGVGVNINVSAPVNFNITAGHFNQLTFNYSSANVAGFINNNSTSVFGVYRDLAGGTWGTNTGSEMYINTTYEAV
jgi:hypothetical protein